jgi:hypothetical protein
MHRRSSQEVQIMANTQPALISLSVEDELGTRASLSLPALLDPAMTVAQASTALAAEMTAIDAIIGANIIGASISVQATQAQIAAATTKDTPAVGSRVEQTGVFDLKNAVTTRLFGIAVPGLSDDVITAGTIDITEDGPVDTWLDLVESAGSATVPQITNGAQQAVTTLADAFLSFRKRRKQLARSSRELGPD